MQPSVVMATIVSTTVSPCLIISATALYTAHIPIPHKRFIFTPVKMLPLQGNAAPTQPVSLKSSLIVATRRTPSVASNAYLMSSRLLIDNFLPPGSAILLSQNHMDISQVLQRPLPHVLIKHGNTTIFFCHNCREIDEFYLSSFIVD